MKRRTNMLIFAICPSMAAMAQNYSQNYIKQARYLNETASDSIVQIQYYDGLGRQTQIVSGGSTSGLYLHTHQQYDLSGRSIRTWSPIVGSTSPDYIEHNDIASMSFATYGDDMAYSHTIYDALNRPAFVSTCGQSWRDKGRAQTYRGNYGNEVKLYSSANLNASSYYEPNMLACTESQDEDEHATYVFTDRVGRTILERKSIDDDYADTYYIYNDLGQLTHVLSPEYQSDPDLGKYAFCYTYDAYGRVASKQLPGCEATRYEYDNADRVIMMQNGVLAQSNNFRFFTYDALGRIKSQGLSDGNELECNEVLYYYDDYSFLTEYPALNLECIDGSILGLDYCGAYQAYAQYGHAQLTGVWQRASNGEGTLSTYVYDNLGQIAKQAEVGLGKRASVTEYTYNYVGDVTTADTKFYAYCAGSNTLEELCHADIQNNYDIPHTKLLTSTVLTIEDYRNGVSMTDTIQHLTYDDFGHITANDRGGTAADMTYSYDLLHGWLEGVSSTGGFSQTLIRESHPSKPLYNGSISAMTWSIPGERTLRRYDYEYDGLNRLKVGRYSHLRIAATGGGPSLSPLSNIPSSFDKPFAVGQDYYTERIGYDLNSNITSLTRYGLTNSRRYDTIDDLSIEYEGNQLTSVSDAASPLVYEGASDFKDAITPVNEYGYNANGALTYDLNRGIRQIEYDHLGNIRRILFQESSGSGVRTVTRNTEYVYSADGRRLRTAHKERSMLIGVSATMDSIDYCGNLILRNGVPDKYLFDGGYVSFDADTLLGVHYYIQDYMGNNRMVVNRDGTTEQITHYYPYGGVIGDISTNESMQPYKFEGKELDRTFGLDNYDIEARQYFAMAPMWDRVDPLAHKCYGISPYAYCGGDPVNYGDLDGKRMIMINGFCPYEECGSPSYWPSSFQEIARCRYGETICSKDYIDGSIGGTKTFILYGMLGEGSNITIENRINAGYQYGASEAGAIISQLKRVNGVIVEPLRIVSHSMGGAYAMGMTKALMEYIATHPEECEGLEFTNHCFAPYQSYKLSVPENAEVYQYSHILDPLAGTAPIKGASQISNFMMRGEGVGHTIYDFFYSFNHLEEGKYIFTNGQWKKKCNEE